MTTRVLIADDEELVRAGVAALLSRDAQVEVIEAADGAEALRLATLHAPDVVILDLTMVPVDGFETLARLGAALPKVTPLVLSGRDDPRIVARALLAGARGYLLKSSSARELVCALHAVTAGQRYLGRGIDRGHVERILVEIRAQRTPDLALTDRQRCVLRLVAEGKTSKEIAALLGVSPKTVEAHRAQIMARTGARDLASLVRFALDHGIADRKRSA